MSLREALLGVPEISPYGDISEGIERLHNICPPVTELKAGSQTIKLSRGDLHGFTVSWPVWYDPPLPPVVRDFLKEGVKDNRLDIYTSVFCVPRVEYHYYDASKPIKPRTLPNFYPGSTDELRKAEEVRVATVGEERYHIVWLSTQRRELEIEVQWGFYFSGDIVKLIYPCFSLRGRFFTVGENGIIERQDDPRNFYTEKGRPSEDQTDLVTNVLRFALEERKTT